MKPKNKKSVLIVIIILLCITAPLGVASVIFKFVGNPFDPNKIVISENPGKEFFYEGLLYFYDENRELLGVYKCDNPAGYCNYAYETIDDNNHNFYFYDDRGIELFTLINNRFALLTDTEMDYNDEHHYNAGVILYDVIDRKEIAKYKAVKNYTIGLEENRLIVQNEDGKWGIISLESDNPKVLSSFNYEYIGLADRKTEDGKLDTSYFVVKESNIWYLLSGETFQGASTQTSDEIVDYNNDYLITKLNLNYYLFNHNATLVLDTNGYNYLRFLGNYVITIDRNNILQVMNPKTNMGVSSQYNVVGKSYSVNLKDNYIEIIINGEVFTHNL